MLESDNCSISEHGIMILIGPPVSLEHVLAFENIFGLPGEMIITFIHDRYDERARDEEILELGKILKSQVVRQKTEPVIVLDAGPRVTYERAPRNATRGSQCAYGAPIRRSGRRGK